MSTRHEDNDGSDIFWPGYVDATTNLILNLLFLLTILIVAVFMFALELGRTVPAKSERQSVEVAAPATAGAAGAANATGAAGTAGTTDARVATDVAAENLALKKEIARLEKLLASQQAEQPLAGDRTRTVEATSGLPKPAKGLDSARADAFEVLVRFRADAIELTDAERDQLRESLQPLARAGAARILVEVPDGFSESRRMGFYRAMAVRNQLILMNVPQEKIDLQVVEGGAGASAELVRVRGR